MALLATSKGSGDFEPVSEGLKHGICYGVYDLGTQHSNDPKFKDKRQVLFIWELPEERFDFETDSGEKKNLPKSVSRRFTLTISTKANLRKFLESWRGQRFTDDELKGFDVSKVLGINCQLQILHKKKDDGSIWAEVTNALPLGKGMEKKEAENAFKLYDISEHGQDIPPNTPDWIVELIQQSLEWAEMSKKDEPPPPPDWVKNAGPQPPPEADGDTPPPF